MKIYVFCCVGLMLGGAYWCGGAVARAQCDAKIANNNHMNQVVIYKKIGDVNAEANHTAVRDIRRVLYEKYTIAE